MAPGAHIVYVGGSDCLDVSLDKALNEVVAERLAQIVSNSYGDLGEDIPADEVAAFQNIVIQAAAQGIGVYFSSGDNGDEVADARSSGSRLLGVEPVGHRGRRHQPRRRRRRSHRDRDRVGDRQERARRRRLRARRRPANSSTARVAARACCSPSPTTRSASSPTRSRTRKAPSPVASCPTSRLSATRAPACSSARPRSSPRRLLRRVPHRWHKPVVARCSPGSWRSPTISPAHRTGSSTRRCTRRLARHGRAITDVKHAERCRRSRRLHQRGRHKRRHFDERADLRLRRSRDRDHARLRQHDRARHAERHDVLAAHLDGDQISTLLRALVRVASNAVTSPLVEAARSRSASTTFVAVDGIDFAIEPGEAFGFLGPNGAGQELRRCG